MHTHTYPHHSPRPTRPPHRNALLLTPITTFCRRDPDDRQTHWDPCPLAPLVTSPLGHTDPYPCHTYTSSSHTLTLSDKKTLRAVVHTVVSLKHTFVPLCITSPVLPVKPRPHLHVTPTRMSALGGQGFCPHSKILCAQRLTRGLADAYHL